MTIKEMASSYQQPEQESKEEEEDSVMAGLMKSADEEMWQTVNLSEMT